MAQKVWNVYYQDVVYEANLNLDDALNLSSNFMKESGNEWEKIKDTDLLKRWMTDDGEVIDIKYENFLSADDLDDGY